MVFSEPRLSSLDFVRACGHHPAVPPQGGPLRKQEPRRDMNGVSDESRKTAGSPDAIHPDPQASPVPTKSADYYAPDSLSVKFYDAIAATDPVIKGDTDFYTGRLGDPQKHVLELGCGTGRVALALAVRGHAVLGVDLSEPMLRQAEAKRQRLPPAQARNVRFRCQDLLTLNLPSRFDAVLAPFYTFNHLGGRAQRAQAMRTIARHMKPGAFAVIHACSPQRMRETRNFKRPGLTIRFGSKSRLEVTWNPPLLDEGRRRREQLVEYQHFAGDGALLQASTERLSYCWFPDAEIERTAYQDGLKLIETLTSFSQEQRDERVYVLEKRDDLR
jgi:SAM-dependent methyltransferase